MKRAAFPLHALRRTRNVSTLQPLLQLSCESNNRFGLLRVRSPLLAEYNLFLFLWVLRCFTSPGALSILADRAIEVCSIRFPHSDISGSQVATHLPEAYRSYATSFIAMWCQGIHHLPLIVHSVRLTILSESLPKNYTYGERDVFRFRLRKTKTKDPLCVPDT